MSPSSLLAALIAAGPATVVLVPQDDRPVSVQLPRQVAAMADVAVTVPPPELLGRFTEPGDPDRILDWLERDPLGPSRPLVLSLDMILYGGLVSSRTAHTPTEQARERLARLARIVSRRPGTRLYAFASVMRLLPTSTLANAGYRLELGRLVSLEAAGLPVPDELRAAVPPDALRDYREARARNHALSLEVLDRARGGLFRYLVFGQDDAPGPGPHEAEARALLRRIREGRLASRIAYVQGVDQLASVLVSRALLDGVRDPVRVVVRYADSRSRSAVPAYETVPLALTVRQQAEASGATVVPEDETWDYTLFVNTPDAEDGAVAALLDAAEQQRRYRVPIALADVNLGTTGQGDPRLFDGLRARDLPRDLLAYAAWNTAANTLGTALAGANMALLGREPGRASRRTALARAAFVLHRLVADYCYNRITRSQAMAALGANPRLSRDEAYGPEIRELESLIDRELRFWFRRLFDEHFAGRPLEANGGSLRLAGYRDLTARLPWPRIFEVALDFVLVDGETANLSGRQTRTSFR